MQEPPRGVSFQLCRWTSPLGAGAADPRTVSDAIMAVVASSSIPSPTCPPTAWTWLAAPAPPLACWPRSSGARKNDWLLCAAEALEQRDDEILAANEKDLAGAAELGLTAAQIDRLRLTPERLRDAAAGLREVAALPDPVGQVRGSSVRPNGLEVHKVGVPLGVMLFIYESRPNVTLDAAALCVKSGNAIILRGGREAMHSNTALHRLLHHGLTSCRSAGRRRAAGDTHAIAPPSAIC